MTTTTNADAIDWQALAEATLDAATKGGVKFKAAAIRAAADYLREKVEAVMVPMTRYNERHDVLIETNGRAIREFDRAEAAEAREKVLREALTRLRDCDWVITLPDRMDAVRDIACKALEATRGE